MGKEIGRFGDSGMEDCLIYKVSSDFVKARV